MAFGIQAGQGILLCGLPEKALAAFVTYDVCAVSLFPEDIPDHTVTIGMIYSLYNGL